MMIMQPNEGKQNPAAPTNAERQLFRVQQVENRTQVSLTPFYDAYKIQVQSYLSWSIKYSIYKYWLVDQFRSLIEELERYKLDAARIQDEWKSRIEKLIQAQELRIQEAEKRIKRCQQKNARLVDHSYINQEGILLSLVDKNEENYINQRANDMKDAAMEQEAEVSKKDGAQILNRLIEFKNRLNGEHAQRKLNIETNYDKIQKGMEVVHQYIENTDKARHFYILRPNQEQATAALTSNLNLFLSFSPLIFETIKNCVEHLHELQEAEQEIVLRMEILRLTIARTVTIAEAPYLEATWKDLQKEKDEEQYRLTNFRNMDRNQHLQQCVYETFKKLDKIRQGFDSLEIKCEKKTITVGSSYEQNEHYRRLTGTVTFTALTKVKLHKNIPILEFTPQSNPYNWRPGKKTIDQEHYIEEIWKEIRDIEELLKEEQVLNEKIKNSEGQRENLNNIKQSNIKAFNDEINLFLVDIEGVVKHIQGDPLNKLSLESYSLFPLLGALMARMTVQKSVMCSGSVGQPHTRTAVYVDDVLRVFARDILQATAQQNSIFVGCEKRVKITNRYPIATLGEILVHPELLGAYRKAQGLRSTVVKGMLENDMSFSLALTIDKICEIILLDLQSHCKNEELKNYALEELKKKNKTFEYAKLGYFAANQLHMSQELQYEAAYFRQLESGVLDESQQNKFKLYH